DVYQDWQWQKILELVSNPPEQPSLSGCVHLGYSSTKAAAEDLSLSGGSGNPIVVMAVASEGPARRAGVLAGYQLIALNGRDLTKSQWSETSAEQLLACLASTNAHVRMDFLDPTPRSHGIPTLADSLAKKPLLRPSLH
ncbi:unnamed protein product, partial [Durusdinium trenchii]